jgi:predicted nucleotide-binding protein
MPDRKIQLQILETLRAAYPNRVDSRTMTFSDSVGENLAYLEEHGLVDAKWAGNFAVANAKITARGIDFLSETRRTTSATPVPQSPMLTAREMKLGIERLQRRITEVEALDPSSLEKWSPLVKALQASIDESLSRIFGHGTVEYERYRRTVDWAEDIPSFGGETSLQQYRDDVTKGKLEAFIMLREAVATLKENLAELEPDMTPRPSPVIDNRKVFIVHGHDDAVRESVARFLQSAGCDTIILNEQANRNRTVIEKIEANHDVCFAVVLLTPDDEGAKKGEPVQPRARQNVLLELGYFMAKLGRDKVCVLKRDQVEIPSDFAGVIWTAFDPAGGWKKELAKELDAAGFTIDWKKAMV